ncbi:MAG: type II secretion system protein GspC [Desulfobacteraceae bacterium]
MVNRYFTIANIFLITTSVYLLVNGFYTVVTARFDYSVLSPLPQTDSKQISSPVDETKSPISQYSAIVDRNLFNITSKKGPAKQPQRIDLDNLKQTDLKLRLWGTVTRQNATSYAVIEDTKTREQNLYRSGDSVQNATVKMIFREKIVLSVDNQDEILTMEEPVASRGRFRAGRRNTRSPRLPVSSYSRKITLNRDRLESAMENLGQLMNQATIRPHIEGGRPAGISITGIKPTAIFRRMRLRNGDIITGVNGRPIESVEDAIAIFEDVTNSSEIQVDIKRRGRRQRLDYQIR